jgi:hypothetical protein
MEVAILPIRFIKSWAEMSTTGAAELLEAGVWWLLMTGAYVSGWKRRSWKNLPTMAN